MGWPCPSPKPQGALFPHTQASIPCIFPPIMATGLAGGLTKPYKGMGPAAPTRPGLPAHVPVPLDAAQSIPLMEKGLTVLGIAISFLGPRSKRGVRCTTKPPKTQCFQGFSIGRGRRTRTLNKGFGDPRVTITPCPYVQPSLRTNAIIHGFSRFVKRNLHRCAFLPATNILRRRMQCYSRAGACVLGIPSGPRPAMGLGFPPAAYVGPAAHAHGLP